MNLYESVESSIRVHAETLRVTNSPQELDVRHAIRWVMRDNPDIFWFVHQYHFDEENGVLSFRYRCSPERSAIIQESIDDVVENDFQINYVRTLTKLEQVTYVYKWLLTYCNYNLNSAYNQNIDSVFVRRNSVCTGYAKAAQYLFKLLGIESCLVFGRLYNDKEYGRHCWNIVNIDGHYYHLDVCLGDLSLEDVLNGAGITAIQRYGDYNYNCFCVSTDEILKTRSIEDVDTLPLCDSNLPMAEIERLSRIDIKERNGLIGCQLTHIGSSADIFLCAKDKNVVLKKFRGKDTEKCKEEYEFMECLKGCTHLLHLNSAYSDVGNNILAIEQSTPIVDLFCSHYYHPTLNGVLKMIKDITLGWLECQQQGIMYRDIHVCNIYKANDGRYKLGDFGSCTYELRGLRERVGNPWFMSPETYISGQFDERSAVYSIMAVLYFVLNGLRPPFVDEHNEEEALQRKMNGEALPEPTLLHSFPKDLAKVIYLELVEKGCAYYPSKRIQTCKELLHIIDVLRSTLKSQRIEIRFFQQDAESILYNKTISNVYIPRDIHHRFAYGEEVERIAISVEYCPQEEIEAIPTTDVPAIIDTDGTSNIEKGVSCDCLPNELIAALDDVNDSSIPMSDDIENYCRTMGYGEQSCNPSSPKGASYQRLNTIKSKQKFDYTPRPEGMSKTGAAIGGAAIGGAGIAGAIGGAIGRAALGSFIDIDGNGSYDEEVSCDCLPSELMAALEGENDVDVSSIPMSDDIENYCRTMEYGEQSCNPSSPKGASYQSSNTIKSKQEYDYTPRPEGMSKTGAGFAGAIGGAGFAGAIGGAVLGWLCGRINKAAEYDEVYSSIFAPSEVKRKSHMIVQVYLHLYEETDKVKRLAQESDRKAERRDYIPLQCKLRKGDKVEVLLNIYGETLFMSDKKNVVWHGSFTKCSFDYFIPKDIDLDELSCVSLLSVNGLPVGEMRFITSIVDSPRLLNPEIIAHKYSKVFISYSHQDESKVKFLHEGLELGSVPHFFDRSYLKPGDVFPQKIQDYINSADLFILCWSENASNSDYVRKERLQALERAFPQVRPEQAAKLRIYPMSIEPRAELPSDMKNYYHFGEI